MDADAATDIHDLSKLEQEVSCYSFHCAASVLAAK
jgi:hypothetical protein